ncbi:MinD/ParA family protein [Thiovibrio frasassiensis]|uniref:MinD/ParA family protein n=1 Tax=Thiovibrio frasassiensis TaxID=2984131 RepID=A0A9X4RKQ6_9BACT|nr:MinD/ParA family protein [Thiovibrio frasassiensis]MDG4474864.1 MinD/ParA family protein [Thiovibrio frasassiensis]
MTHSQTQKKRTAVPRGRTEPQPRVICVTSGKGGVGKTNIVTNLGYALAKGGKKVLILDADLNLANVDILLGLTPRYNLHHVFMGEKTLQEVLVQGPEGLLILPASSGIMELADLTEQQRLYFLSEMSALAQKIDIMLIDTAAGINNNVIYFNLAARERIIILTPEPTSLTDAYALVKVLSSRHDVKKFRILVNLARSEKEALAVFRKLSIVADRFLDSLSLDYLGYIPYDSKLPTAVREQRLVSDIFPDAPSSKMFSKVAGNISQEEPEMKADGNIKFFWQGLVDL